ncbi:MAG: CusA/CzcA family heavy metal efflux RND transporter, partial [Bacteroidota bacterium]|nr:CusA/CzcA family heavy metal efflux RND transporter [Bacteroidota bacterium]
EGALIVLFVLIIFLGNLRAGLIVASVIPLSMLFAVVMMNFFGVSGNLMSLGALDFGLLVDGAVIIVEAVMHKIVHSHAYIRASKLSQHQMNKEVETSAGKMMSSAAFGQIVILIVYLPILSLQGIEGKMFKPMAETVSFAILGAFILSLTYVPMVTSLFLSKKVNHKKNFSDKMMYRLQLWYKPILIKVLKIPSTIVAISFIFFIAAIWLLTTLGGEFIPKLEEGDFAVDTRLLTGSSLTNTIATTEKTASVLLHQFPEVEKVVTKIGSGEIPTDPMPVEAADMMVILKDKKTWKSAKTFDELAEKMSKALEAVPGVATGFQFPVQMRFNELMTGARQDVVCKIFGDDLDSLAKYANALGNIIQSVKGARDLYVETVTGVPQIVIHYNRAAIAKYAANVNEINTAVQAAYAGATAGLVFEGDKRYDLVIRLDNQQRESISNIGNLQIGVANGQQIPLNNLASIEITDGPYQIQREDAHRRITVGFNVRGRDVESIVNELHDKVEKQLKFPPGYYITYGGQYENLQRATKRLSIAVPVALLLILLMLYFAFHNIKYALLIFSAIPLSAIGGVFALFLRGMPFSISAGVGFIALFGVAVLNGIVLIGEMNRLKLEGNKSIVQIIIQATQIRLRPVLMTASVASLGFLPMALSNGAGAEVQRPLATVVIGGLITATLLTLLVLPSLYLLFETKKKPMKRKLKYKLPGSFLLLFLLFVAFAQAQSSVKKISLIEITEKALQNAPAIKVSLLQEKYNQAMEGTASEIPKMQFNAELGNYNSMFFDSRLMIMQNFSLPGYYASLKKLLITNTAIARAQSRLQKAEIKKLVEQLYITLQYQTAQLNLLQRLDSIYAYYKNIATLRYDKGESNLLEKTTLENTADNISVSVSQIKNDILSTQLQMQLFTQENVLFEPADTLSSTPLLVDTIGLKNHPFIELYKQQQQQAAMLTKVEKAKLQPDFVVGYNNQSIVGWQLSKDRVEDYYNASSRFSSFSLGMGIPLFNKAQHARIAAAAINEKASQAATEAVEHQLETSFQKYAQLFHKYSTAVHYYKTKGLLQANVLMQTASLQYKSGAINYIEWGTLLSQSIALQNDYLNALYNQQMAISEIHYLLN